MIKIRKRTKSEFKEDYELNAKNYDITRSKTRMGRFIDKMQIDFIYKQISKNKNIRILEAGCGTGRILIPLAEKGIECYGIDPSNNMLDTLKKKKGELDIELKTGDIENIPYPDNTFDFVYTMHVLMHMPRFEEAIKEMYRVVKPGGKVIADFPNKNSPYTLASLITSPKKARTNLFTIKTLKKLFKGYDYTITGLFSYSKTIYAVPIIGNVVYIFEKIIKLPICLRSQLIVVVKK